MNPDNSKHLVNIAKKIHLAGILGDVTKIVF